MTDVAAPSTATTTEPPEPKARRRSIGQWFADQDSRELLVWGVLIALTILVRVIGLANRPFHHDESQDAYFSYLFRKTGDYEYNPLLHGPLRFYLTGAMYFLFGDTSFTARLAPVLMGFLMIPMCWGLRACSDAARRSSRRCCSRSGRAICTSAASPARTSTSPRSRSRW